MPELTLLPAFEPADGHALLRLPGQPQGRPREERRPHGLLLHAGRRPVRAGRRHGRPPGRRGRFADGAADAVGAVPARGQARAGGSAALPARRHHRRPPPAVALRHRAGADGHAAHHRRGLRAAGQRRLLGALRRLAAVPGARRQAGGAHARPLLFRTAGDAGAGGAHGRPRQPQRALHLPGQPRQAGGRHRRPAGRAPGDRVMLCSDGLWGTVDDGNITEVLARHPISEAVPELVERRCAPVAKAATTSPCWRSSGKRPKTGQRRRRLDESLGERSLLPPSRPAWAPARPATNSTKPRSSARSARSTKPSSAVPASGVRLVVPPRRAARRGSPSFSGSCHDI